MLTSPVTSSDSSILCGTLWQMPLASATTTMSSLAAFSQLFSSLVFFPLVCQHCLNFSFPPPLFSFKLILYVPYRPSKVKTKFSTVHDRRPKLALRISSKLASNILLLWFWIWIILCYLRKTVPWVTAVVSFWSLVFPATIILTVNVHCSHDISCYLKNGCALWLPVPLLCRGDMTSPWHRYLLR